MAHPVHIITVPYKNIFQWMALNEKSVVGGMGIFWLEACLAAAQSRDKWIR